MPFIGKQPTAGFASIVKDDLTADGSTTAFTLSKQVANANDIAVFVGNVRQEPTDAYTVSGTTLTMSAAPASAINFYVLHIAGTVESSVVPADGTITNAKIVGMASSKLTGALPAISGAALTDVDATTTYGGEMLICAGGGSGGCGQDGSHYGGGAGAGQVLHMLDFNYTVGEVYTITVGAGVSWSNNQNSAGTPGNPSTVEVGNSGKVFSMTGGGRGSGYYNSNAGTPGGGGAYPGTGSPGAQQGNFSDPSFFRIGNPFAGASYGSGGQAGGGGGALSAGINTGLGGGGYTSTITGSSVEYSIGGHRPDVTANTTYGSGGNGGRNADVGSDGIQGVVIMRFPTSNYSGTTTGTVAVTTDGIYTILTFTGNGSYTG